MSYPQEQFANVRLDPRSLLGRRRTVASRQTIFTQLDALKSTGRYNAFELKWHPIYSQVPTTWPVPDHMFWDSDVGKWMEAACYLLSTGDISDPAIETAIDELVTMIRTAQHPDGYLNIHYTVVEPGLRFTNLRDMHELYNAGHLIEAALAHNLYFQNDRLLEPICRYVDLLCETFGPGPGQIHGYPGHPEIELALLRLYHRTKKERYLELGKYFIMERGNTKGVAGQHFYTIEATRRGHHAFQRPDWWPESTSRWYCQAHLPIAEHTTIEGHAVRAMYLYTATTDLVRAQEPSHPKLKDAVSRLWSNMVSKKMYATGGIGAIKGWEGFGGDYFLPQSTDEGGCYAETCAAIGVMMWADRIRQYDLDGKYGDIMELALYNAVLTAMSHDGKEFTYVNQLGSSNETPSTRHAWFTVCCCPPNLLRLLGHIGGYVATQTAEEKGTSIGVHLYTPSTFNFTSRGHKGTLVQQTEWPLDGAVRLDLQSADKDIVLKLRIPGWAESWEMSPPLKDASVEKGYLTVPKSYITKSPSFTITFPMKPRLVYSHPHASHSMVAVARGPIVYCAEDVDNPWVIDHFKNVHLEPDCEIVEEKVNLTADENYISLTVKSGVFSRTFGEEFTAPGLERRNLGILVTKETKIESLVLVPYYHRTNRGGKGQMRVGMKPSSDAIWVRPG